MQYFFQLPVLEALAVLLAIAYLILVIYQNIWCWYCAGLSTSIYVFLFAHAQLYMESLLNIFYLFMAVYVLTVWKNNQHELDIMEVQIWPIRIHCLAVFLIIVLSLTVGYLLEKNTDAIYPYIDSLTTFSAIWATFLVARKVLENWWYWFFIDCVSVVIYWMRDLHFTSFLFLFYILLIPIGFILWRRSYNDRLAVTG